MEMMIKTKVMGFAHRSFLHHLQSITFALTEEEAGVTRAMNELLEAWSTRRKKQTMKSKAEVP